MTLTGLYRQFASLSLGCVSKLTQNVPIKNAVCLPRSLSLLPHTNLTRSYSVGLRSNRQSYDVRSKHKLCQHYFIPQLNIQRGVTLNQMHRKGKRKIPPRKFGMLDGNPFKRALVLKTIVKKPKKPNSASRKCVRVKLSNGVEATAYIPKEGHNLQEHNIVLVGGGKVQDVPGVKLTCIRGKYDLQHVVKKKQA